MRNLFLMFVLAFMATACTTTHYKRGEVEVDHFSIGMDREGVEVNITRDPEDDHLVNATVKVGKSNGSKSFNKAIDGIISSMEALKAGAM